MHEFVTSKNVKWCHLIWPTLYARSDARLIYCAGTLSVTVFWKLCIYRAGVSAPGAWLSCSSSVAIICLVVTARCTLVQSAVLRSHVVCLSVCPSVSLSVTLVNCDHIGWNSSKIISPLVSLGRSLFATPT